jgi:hypothetical protein
VNSQGNALIGNMFAEGNTLPIALYRQWTLDAVFSYEYVDAFENHQKNY